MKLFLLPGALAVLVFAGMATAVGGPKANDEPAQCWLTLNPLSKSAKLALQTKFAVSGKPIPRFLTEGIVLATAPGGTADDLITDPGGGDDPSLIKNCKTKDSDGNTTACGFACMRRDPNDPYHSHFTAECNDCCYQRGLKGQALTACMAACANRIMPCKCPAKVEVGEEPGASVP